jgi:hypothetical protein
LGSADAEIASNAESNKNEIERIMRLRQNYKTLWENDIDVAPILGAYGAFTGPVGRIVQMIGDMRGPKAGDVTIKEIALDRLAQACGATGGIDFPSGEEHQRAAHGYMRLGTARILEGDNIVLARRNMLLDAQRLAIYSSKMLHAAFLSAK